jgi:ring hydroxylating enzyme beta subunit
MGGSIDILPHGIADGEIVHHTRARRAHEPRLQCEPIRRLRVQRLRHPAIHSQIPRSKTVRLVANFKLETHAADPSLYRLLSKFVMLEDRPGYARRLFGGRYTHVLRGKGGGLEIVLKRVDPTNCDQSFPSLTRSF